MSRDMLYEYLPVAGNALAAIHAAREGKGDGMPRSARFNTVLDAKAR